MKQNQHISELTFDFIENAPSALHEKINQDPAEIQSH